MLPHPTDRPGWLQMETVQVKIAVRGRGMSKRNPESELSSARLPCLGRNDVPLIPAGHSSAPCTAVHTFVVQMNLTSPYKLGCKANGLQILVNQVNNPNFTYSTSARGCLFMQCFISMLFRKLEVLSFPTRQQDVQFQSSNTSSLLNSFLKAS